MIIHSPDELALLVSNHRKQNKMSQAEASELVGLKQATISAFENTPTGTKLDTLFRILAAVNLEIHVVPKGSQKWDSEW